MELFFLGTGSGIPSKERNVSSVALKLLQEQNSIWLFDCGEATQHQILHTTIKPRKITKIFITHMHGDHIFGLPGLLSSRSFQGGTDPLTIYGPEGIKDFVETSLSVSGSSLTYPLSIIEFTEGELFEDEHFRVSCKKLEHGMPSFGFRIREKDKPGKLLVDKLKAAGVEPGPIYQQIKDNDIVHTDDGRIIRRDDYLGPVKKGRIVTILGDTRSPEKNQSFVKGSDVLVHEATFGDEKKHLAKAYCHSTAKQAARLAIDSDIGKLILTHISSRYQQGDDDKLTEEARKIFPMTELANDFHQVSIESK
ncbi:ribonuclease Z [Lentibacillus amyloliquefaciens]|uniref:Ribonuclease Z n=1 Tax=Lentibacillus amyloliquefaciens TaxID=1472767 RepID=A0A0U4F5F8_9BACI|nr:ribonuclease Z [Lentibacillus amyloliquefaciens]ALX48019.1 ribonuclease Z [Lentibacillus amyloliquefaciens]